MRSKTSQRVVKKVGIGHDRTFGPFRDRRVSVRSVACPVCRVPKGKGCVTVADGRSMGSTSHAPRRGMAIRAGL